MATPQAQPQKRLPLVVVLAPLLAVLGIAGVVGWNLYRDWTTSEAEDAEASKQLTVAQGEKARAAREQKHPDEVKPQPTEEDDLGNLPGQKKKNTAVKPVAGTPAQKAYGAFKTAYDKLENTNENAAKKFRVRKLQLDDQFNGGKPVNETKFVADCEATRSQIIEALRNPENQ
jgi:hypothetical protein